MGCMLSMTNIQNGANKPECVCVVILYWIDHLKFLLFVILHKAKMGLSLSQILVYGEYAQLLIVPVPKWFQKAVKNDCCMKNKI